MGTLLDQFEVEPNVFYSGSYTDSLFSGSLLAGNRRIIASQTSGSNELRTAQLYSDFADYSGSNRTRSLGMGLRFRHFVSNTERYQDTILPDILGAFYVNGGIPVLALVEYGATPILVTETDADIGGAVTGKLIFTTYGSSASYGGTSVADRTWIASSPFQQTYKDVPRTVVPGFYRSSIYCPVTESRDLLSGVLYYGEHLGFPSSSLSSVEVIIPLRWTDEITLGRGATQPIRFTLIDVTGSVTTGEAFQGPASDVYPPATDGLFGNLKGTRRPRSKQLTKFLFGFGDNYQGVPIVNAVTSSKLQSTIGVINGYYASSIDIRGWKFGVVNGFPYYTSCVFRSSRYGQFRDMLEQRKYTKFFNGDGFTADGKNNGKKGSTSAAVTVRFVSGSNTAVTASNPLLNPNDSGIYDFECKAGQPFHDV